MRAAYGRNLESPPSLPPLLDPPRRSLKQFQPPGDDLRPGGQHRAPPRLVGRRTIHR
jgi:hypothetical protein